MALAEEILMEFVEAADLRPPSRLQRRWWWKPDGASTTGRNAMFERHKDVHPTPRYWCAVCNPRGGSKQNFADQQLQLLLFADAE